MTPLREQFIRELTLRGMSPRTEEAYIAAVAGLARYYKKSPDKITDEEVKAYLFYLARERQRAPSSLNQVVSAVRSFQHLVLQRPLESLERTVPRVRHQVRRPQVFSIKELEILFTVGCSRPLERAFLMTVYGAGLRLGEAVALRPEHLLAERMQIRIELGKGGKDRYTLLSPRLLEELRSYWRACRPGEWLFPSPKDPTRHLCAHTGQLIFWRAVKRAGLPRHGGIHSLRHSFATHLIECGTEIPVLQRLLGHRNLSTTLGYLHVRQERIARIVSPLQLLELSRPEAAPASTS
jgi:integrase/recombinase XerD